MLGLIKLSIKEQEVLNEAILTICKKDWDDYQKSLYRIIDILAGQGASDLLETDPMEAYKKYFRQ